MAEGGGGGDGDERGRANSGALFFEGWNEPAILEGALRARREARPLLLLNPAHRALPGVGRWLETLGVPREARSGGELPPDLPLLEGLPRGFHALLLTSGTTGTPRLVALDEASVRWNVEAVTSHLALAPDTEVVLQVPVFHAFGLVLGLYLAEGLGGRGRSAAPGPLPLHCVDRFAPDRLLAWLASRPPDAPPLLLPFVPAMVRSLPAPGALPSVLREAVARTRGVAIVGGDRVRRRDLEHLMALLPRVRPTVGYGLTEAGPALTHTAVPPEGRLPPGFVDGGVGAPLPGVTLTLSPGGEARFRSPGQAPFLREAGLRESGRRGPGDPWTATGRPGAPLETGDLLAPLPPPGSGFRFLGRRGWSFKKGGERISPVLVEEVLVLALEERGFDPVDLPALVLTKGAGEGVELLVEGARNEVLERAIHDAFPSLPSFFRPDALRWIAAFPRNALGKIERSPLGEGRGDG